ncbi:hypothetical protein ACFLXP_02175 [Chloroflexota bacterium]
MSKKLKILISALAVVTLLILGTTATVLADETEDETVTEETDTDSLLGRVAGILGIDQDDLKDAFTQARDEMKESAFTNRLGGAVENGTITQEQADEILEWWAERPEDATGAWYGHFGHMAEKEFGMLRRAQNNLRYRLSLGDCMGNGFGQRFCPGPAD